MRPGLLLSQDLSRSEIDLDYIRLAVRGSIFRMQHRIELPSLAKRQRMKLSTVVPLTQILSALIKPLHAAILAIGNVQVSIWSDCDCVYQIELAGPGAVLAPFAKLHSPYTKGNFEFDRVVTGWRGSHPVLDLRLKR